MGNFTLCTVGKSKTEITAALKLGKEENQCNKKNTIQLELEIDGFNLVLKSYKKGK